MMQQRDISVVLHNVRSAENVGSIFRTADAAGVSRIYLSGYTPTPLDRFGRKNAKISKSALGAEDAVPWEHSADTADCVRALRGKGVSVVAVEQHNTSVPYDTYNILGPTAFIFGNEVEGVPENILVQCDSVVEIPMHGRKESLNVAVAAGIILFNTRLH